MTDVTILQPQAVIDQIATEVLSALADHRQITPLTARPRGLGLADAYRVTAVVRRMREARGERVVGRKIGFTNQTIWDEYGVYAPIWGYVYDTTLHRLQDIGDTIDLSALVEPRIEPEIAFGLRRSPEPDMDEGALLDCIEWVAHGFEIVQSLFPGWRFQAADTVAAFGLHGALLLGPQHAVTAADRDLWHKSLAGLTISLSRDGVEVDQGQASNVLGGGPLAALRHLVEVLTADPNSPSLTPGEVVTTGTLSKALPIAPGQSWSTRLAGIPIAGLSVTFGQG